MGMAIRETNLTAPKQPNFGAMKKSQFKGLDLVCVNTFKAPIEKFNSLDDLRNWAATKLNNDIFSKTIEGRTPLTVKERTSSLEQWKDFLLNKKNVITTAALVTMASLTKALSPKTDDVPPPVDQDTFEKTMQIIQNENNVNFKNVYSKELKNRFLNDEEIKDGWIKIPSYGNDTENFEKNVQKLKILSSDTWCTKSSSADGYLRLGDFYIYYKNGKPELGVKMLGDDVDEIQSVKNNMKVPPEKVNEIHDFLKENKLNLTPRAKDSLYVAEMTHKAIQEYREKLKKDIESGNNENILAAFGMNITEENGEKVLDCYKDYYNYSAIGIDTENILKGITKIEGNANFSDLPYKINLSSLKEIGGNVYLHDSQMKPSDLKAIKINGEIKE